MNAKTLLYLLKDDFSDENVATAIAWLKTKEPTNKSASKVLSRIFPHPLIESELEWLTTWAKDGDWEFLAEHIYELKSVLVFDRIIQLLTDNADHANAGRIWATLLQNFRNSEIEEGAESWLNKKRLNTDYEETVLSELLRLNPTPARTQLARQLYEINQDIFLLCSLIENAKDKDARAIGEERLEKDEEWWSKEMLAVALTNCDIDAHKVSIGKFLANPDSREAAKRYVQDIIIKQPVAFFLLDWIAENHEMRLAKQLLTWPLMMEADDPNGAALWSWYESGDKNEIRLEVCLRVMDNSWCPLPPEAVQYVSTWREKNKGHRLERLATNALSRVRKSLESVDKSVSLKGHSDQSLKGYGDQSLVGDILKKRDFSVDLFKEAQEIVEKHLYIGDQVTVSVQLFKQTKDYQDLSLIKELFQKSNLSFKAFILAEVLPLGVPEFVDLALETLRVKRLYRRYGPDYKNIGSVILNVLRVEDKNEEIFSIADSWLKIKPDEQERELYEQVSSLVSKARSN